MPLAHQIILRPADDRVIAPDANTQRELSRRISEVARPFRLTVHNTADGHAHLQCLEDRARAAELGRRLLLSLQTLPGPDTEWEPARVRPVHDQRHCQTQLLYILRQRPHHGLALDPFHEASALPDLLGLRVIAPELPGRIAAHLPRVRRGLLLELLGCDPWELEARQVTTLSDAVAAAVGRPSGPGRWPELVDARAAGIQLARPHFSCAAVAAALQASTRTVLRLGHRELSPALLRAVEGQWALRSHVASQQAVSLPLASEPPWSGR